MKSRTFLAQHKLFDGSLVQEGLDFCRQHFALGRGNQEEVSLLVLRKMEGETEMAGRSPERLSAEPTDRW